MHSNRKVRTIVVHREEPNDDNDYNSNSNEKKDLLKTIFMKNKRDRHIEVPPEGSLGALATRPKLVTRGGVGDSENFETIKRNVLKSGGLYEDPDFPASHESIYYSSKKIQNFKWMRPHEICSNPKFILGEASRFDVCQGELGDCWLLAAVSSLSLQKLLMNQVIPPNQSFERGDYCGAFKFHFWHFGQWKEVIIDDRLPTRNNKLIFMHSQSNNEFWSALLEKAYAKLYGAYELLKGGSSVEAMEDFTGGISEYMDIKDDYRNDSHSRDKLFEIMKASQSKMSLMGAAIPPDPRKHEAQLSNGLVMGHAYSITAVKEINAHVPGYRGNIRLVRLRNPWGTVEWKGEWSDNSDNWRQISDRDRGHLGLNFENDGEFWMSYEDFINNFEKLEICHLGPQSIGERLSQATTKKGWESTLQSGAWKNGVSAGGCLNYPDTFWTNPQFRIKIEDADKDDNENLGTVIVGLMQKNSRSVTNRGKDLHTIGYVIYKVGEEQKELLDRQFFRYNRKVAMSPTFVNLREVCGRHRLEPGYYVIIPSTFEPKCEGEFLLRAFAEREVTGKEMDVESGLDASTLIWPPKNNNHGRRPRSGEPVKNNVSVISDEERIQLERAFAAVSGEDMEVDAKELQDILNSAFRKEKFFKSFSIDTCRSIVAMLDADLSGRLGFEEFLSMWIDMKLWKSIFKKKDQDESGTLNSYELRELLNEIGFRISNKVFASLVTRFASGEHMTMEFDDFIHCCVRLSTIFATYQSAKKDSSNNAIFDQDTFIQSAIYS